MAHIVTTTAFESAKYADAALVCYYIACTASVRFLCPIVGIGKVERAEGHTNLRPWPECTVDTFLIQPQKHAFFCGRIVELGYPTPEAMLWV